MRKDQTKEQETEVPDYREELSQVCGADWLTASPDERDGALGVALVMAFREGARANLEELSARAADALFLTPEERQQISFEIPFRRLMACGCFFPPHSARRDRALNGWEGSYERKTAWCHIAGCASGFIGAGYYIRREVNKQPALN
jgi:hypothetical protein